MGCVHGCGPRHISGYRQCIDDAASITRTRGLCTGHGYCLVSLTPKGSEMVARGKELLDFHFDQLMATAGVDIQQYRQLSEQIFQSLVAKTKKELV
jgi:hypothetical protein